MSEPDQDEPGAKQPWYVFYEQVSQTLYDMGAGDHLDPQQRASYRRDLAGAIWGAAMPVSQAELTAVREGLERELGAERARSRKLRDDILIECAPLDWATDGTDASVVRQVNEIVRRWQDREQAQVWKDSFPTFKRFVLVRDADVSGISGTGIVCYGVQFPDGKCVTRWRSERAQTCVWDSLSDVEAIHGHAGATRIEWI